MSTLLGTAVLGLVVGLALTRGVMPLAMRLDLVDRPDGHRKLHQRVTPLGGGLAVYLSVLVVLGIVSGFAETAVGDAVRRDGAALAPLLAAAGLIVLLGVLDDRFQLRGRHKLLGQILVTGLLVASGTLIRNVELFGWRFELGMLAIPLTAFWLLGAVNSLNLLDGVDGLAGTIGVILSVTVAAMAVLTGHIEVAVVTIALAGSLLGFLCFNLSGKIFLGDAGSMLIGLVVGVLAIQASLKGPATVALAAPLAVWAIPILDSLAAILRRKLTGRSIYSADRGHLHHCLMARFGKKSLVVGCVGVCCALTCVGAWASLFLRNDALALLSMGAVTAILLVTRIFGHVELMHFAREVRAFGREWLRLLPAQAGQPNQNTMGLNASEQWDVVWCALTESANKFNLTRIRLDVTLPFAGEGYHASWQRPSRSEAEQLWRAEIPLFTADRVVGRLIFAGERDYASSCGVIESLMALVQPLEAQLAELATSPRENESFDEAAPAADGRECLYQDEEFPHHLSPADARGGA